MELTLKVINDVFGAHVARLETTLKTTQAKVGREENIGNYIGVAETVEEPMSNAPGLRSDHKA